MCLPKVAFAGWVGTIKHNTMTDDVESRTKALVLWWLDEGNRESDKKYGAHKKKKNTHHVVISRLSLQPV